MRVAVVTPYYKEPDRYLRQCHESVRGQTHPCTQIFVADGHPRDLVDGFDAQHIRLAHPYGDAGNTPRGIGSIAAVTQGFDAIAYLDADNLYHPDHIAGLVEAQARTGAAVCSSWREMCHMDDLSVLAQDHTDDRAVCDTNAMMLFGEALRFAPAWAEVPREFALIGDRVVWREIVKSGLRRHRLEKPTVIYREAHRYIYQHFGLPLPEGCREVDAIREAERLWVAAGGAPIAWRFLQPKPGLRMPPRPLPPNCE